MTRSPSHGFTLIELAIVIAIVAILSTALAPSLIDSAKSDLAERAAEEFTQIVDASLWYFGDQVTFEVGAARDPRNALWPGQPSPANCTTVSDAAFAALSQGYLHLDSDAALGDTPLNPWREPYVISLASGLAPGPYPHCQLKVSTEVPQEVGPNLRLTLSRAECVPGVRSGFWRCSTTIPKPGAQASIATRFFKRNRP
jgi:prepilin-type N-terminal cleavage/methylation domain-containing protein